MNNFKTFYTEALNDNFKKWFGKSKVVKGGKPLIVYHGTKGKFNKFDLNRTGTASDTGMWGKGFYFSDNEAEAKTYGNVISVYLSIQNPLYIKSKSDIPNIEVPEETMDDLANVDINYSIAFRDYAIRKGYDGVIVHMGYNEYVAFYPNQIKSTHNKGEYSKSNIDIHK